MIDNNLNPYALLLIGIQRIDKTFFENLKQNVESYRYLLLIMHKFKNNKKYSAEEMIVLFFKELFFERDIAKEYEKHREGNSYFSTFRYRVGHFLNNLENEILLLSIFLKDVGFDFGPKGLTFEELFLKYEKPLKKYLVEYELDYGICKTTKINDYCQLLKKEASQEILEQERIISAPKSEDKRFIRK